MRHVKVMAAYFCPPLWLYQDASGIPINVDASELPLPADLVARIEAWDLAFQRTFDDGPGFASEVELEAHMEEGIEITAAIADALGRWSAGTIFEPNAELRAGVTSDPEWTLVRAPRALVFDPEMTRKTA